ncbi:uncharacterized protein LOC113204714 [Frankliniella occidentalis]|uniref:Uncharacterized protein LOC113204714 n=1 Tax=Frankliniella occidentalis TaxID=133901 RepID=A0A6J1S945_FRAOC|nr:uncharacterized protein LOC113204714 [Frankliniella occidentalis]
MKAALFLAAALAAALCISAASAAPAHSLSKRGVFSSCFPCLRKAPTGGSSKGGSSIHAAPASSQPSPKKNEGKGKAGASHPFGQLPAIPRGGAGGASGPNRQPLKDITNTHPSGRH